MSVTSGSKVSIQYVLKVEDKVVDSNLGGEPLEYTQGSQQIVPGLEKKMEGMEVGETKVVLVAPEEGYGALQEQAIVEVPSEQIPEEARKIGAMLQSQTPDGQVMQSRVTEIKDDVIVLDFNHPLAGKTLEFEVKVIGIE